MNIFISGGTGFIGSSLAEAFAKDHSITIAARHITEQQKKDSRFTYIECDMSQPGDWQNILSEQDIIINLAGASIFTRWNRQKKKIIYDSRIITTKNIVTPLLQNKGKVKKIINASAVGYYGFHEDELLKEDTPAGKDFLAQVCRDWEHEAIKAEQTGITVSLCRFGIVLGKNGGSLQQMAKNAKMLAGGYLGSGTQWVSWIHENDLLNILLYAIENTVSGPVNCCSPEAVTNKTLTRSIARVLKKPVLMPFVPGFLLKLVLGEFGDVLLKGQRAYPQKLLDSGFTFQFSNIQEALADLLVGE